MLVHAMVGPSKKPLLSWLIRGQFNKTITSVAIVLETENNSYSMPLVKVLLN